MVYILLDFQMSSPNRLANLTFSYASTSSAFRSKPKKKIRELSEEKNNNKTLASTSRIFSTEKTDQVNEATRSESFRKVESSYREKLEKTLESRLKKNDSFKELNSDDSFNTNSLENSLDLSLNEQDHYVYEEHEGELWDSSFSKSEENIETNIELDDKSNVQRNTSFSVPRNSRLHQNGPSVAKVTRSNSRRLIDDENNLKSLFQRARSNENLYNHDLYIDNGSQEQSNESFDTRARSRSFTNISGDKNYENQFHSTSVNNRSELIKTRYDHTYEKNLHNENRFYPKSSIQVEDEYNNQSTYNNHSRNIRTYDDFIDSKPSVHRTESSINEKSNKSFRYNGDQEIIRSQQQTRNEYRSDNEMQMFMKHDKNEVDKR